jgi:hypothetical protein
MSPDQPDKTEKIHKIVQQILCADLDDKDTYVGAFELLGHMLRHVPEEELDYFLYEMPEEVETFADNLKNRHRKHLRVVT